MMRFCSGVRLSAARADPRSVYRLHLSVDGALVQVVFPHHVRFGLPCVYELHYLTLDVVTEMPGMLRVGHRPLLALAALTKLSSIVSQSKGEWFLGGVRIEDGRKRYVHERLRTARNGLDDLVKSGQLFAFVEMRQGHGGSWSSTNNCIENTNARLRAMTRDHRGLSTVHEAKACFWWLLMHTECPPSAAEILRAMLRDGDMAGLFAAAAKRGSGEGGGDGYGSGLTGTSSACQPSSGSSGKTSYTLFEP